MLSELVGKSVVVHLGTLAGLTDTVRGKVVAVGDQWIQVQGKKHLEFVLLAAIKRISLTGQAFD